MIRKIISPTLLGLVIVCFFLPWVNVSCQNYKIASLSGIDFVVGKKFDMPFSSKDASNMPQDIPLKFPIEDKINPQLFVILSLLAIIGGIALSFVGGKTGALSTGIISAVSFVLLLFQKFKLENEIVQKSQRLIQVEYLFGFYITLIILISVAVLNIYYSFTFNDDDT